MRHLLIDEYQDTNSSQDALVKLLGRGGGLALRRRRRGPVDLPLAGRRGRAHPPVRRGLPGRARHRARSATTARRRRSSRPRPGVVSHNRRRREKKLRADRGDGRGRAPLALRGGPRRGRGRRRARSRAPAASPGEIAILYRTNAQSRPFEEELVRRRIPYVVVGGHEVLRARGGQGRRSPTSASPRGREDDLAFRRVVNVPARGIGAATLDKLAAAVRETGKSWWEVSADPVGRSRAGAHGARALPRHRRGPAREGRDVDAVGASRAPARRHGLRRALRGLRGPRGRGAPREHPGAPLLGARVRAPQRRGRDGRRVPRHRRARDERGRRSRAAAP